MNSLQVKFFLFFIGLGIMISLLRMDGISARERIAAAMKG